jgi:hypothetical protein
VRTTEKGSALIVSLLATTLLFVLGLSLALVAQTESALSAAVLRQAQTAWAADAALRRASADLEALPDWTPALSGVVVSTLTDGPIGVVRTIGRSVVDLPALGASLNASAGSLPFGANNPFWSLYLWAPGDRLFASPVWSGYVAVWVADDAAESDDDPRQDGGGVERRGRGVVRLHAEAFDRLGSRYAVEATALRLISGRVRLLTAPAVR